MDWGRFGLVRFSRPGYDSGVRPYVAMLILGALCVGLLLEARDAFFSGASELDPGGITFEQTPVYGFLMLGSAGLCLWGMKKFWKYQSSEIE